MASSPDYGAAFGAVLLEFRGIVRPHNDAVAGLEYVDTGTTQVR
jgi:hypothetical protein